MRVKIETALDRILAKPGAKFVTLVTVTRPKLLKKSRLTGLPCPYSAGVKRIAERYGAVAVSYENCVNNQRGREGCPVDETDTVQYFEVSQLWNGKGRHVEGSSCLVEHVDTGKRYVGFMPRSSADNHITMGADKWVDLATGAEVDPAQLTDYLPIDNGSKNQETEKRVYWRTIALESIALVKGGGELYEIVGEFA